jgi:hypothetical protein
MFELPVGWRVFELKQRLSGEWTCRLQQINYNIYLYSGRSPTAEIAFEKAKLKMKETSP